VAAWRRRRTRQSATALAVVTLAAAGVVLGIRATSGAPSQPGPASIPTYGSTANSGPNTQPLGRACNKDGIIADISDPARSSQPRLRMSFEAPFQVGTRWGGWWGFAWLAEDTVTSRAYDGKQSLRIRVTGQNAAVGTTHIAGLTPGDKVTVHIWYGGQGSGYICPFAQDKQSTDLWIPQEPLRLMPSDRPGWHTYTWSMPSNFVPLGTGFQLNKTSRSDLVILLDAVSW
jgi:hypothetical protein